MSEETKLPDGLQLAVNELLKLAESNRNMGPLDQGSFFDRRALAMSASADAIRAEHAQRTTLQHHAAYLAQRVANLEAERDELRARLGAVAGKAGDLVAEIHGLMDESSGVAGLHLNGDVAEWDSLLPGSRFERLSSIDDLDALLSGMVSAAPEHKA